MIIICIRLWFKLSIACMKLIAYLMYYTMLMLIEFARIIMDVFNKLFMSGNIIGRGRVDYEVRRY